MAEYIEREALLKWALDSMDAQRDVVGKAYCAEFVRAIRQFKAADVAPVVRCRDCKHWEKGDFMGGDTPDSLEYGGGCPLVRFARYESDFCSYGERKDGDG